MIISTSKNKSDYFYTSLGFLLILMIWQLLSMRYNSVLVPSPRETLIGLKDIWSSGALTDSLTISFQRQLAGLTIGLLIGISSGVIAGLNRGFELMIQPFINALLAIPAIIFVVMAMVWFGMGTSMAIFLVALLVFPIMHLNTIEGYKSIDHSLLEMGKVYKLPLFHTITKIYLPGLTHSLIAGFSLATATSIRLTVMAELLGAREGIGQKIAISRAYMETEHLFAWVLVLVAILIMVELILIRPLNSYSLRWKNNYE